VRRWEISLNSGSLGQMLQRSGTEAMVATDFCDDVEQCGSNDEIDAPTLRASITPLLPLNECYGHLPKNVIRRRRG